MAAILDLCKLDLNQTSHVIITAIIVSIDLENIGIDTKIIPLRVSDLELWTKIHQNGGHFEFMQIRHTSSKNQLWGPEVL